MSLELRLVKTATDATAAKRLAREALWLRELGEVPSLEGQLPRLLEEGIDAQGRPFLTIGIQEASGETRAFTNDHARFLSSLGKARFRAAEFEVSGKCQWMHRALSELPEKSALLQEAYYDCETALLYWTGPYVLSQGDFAPWNIRQVSARSFSSSTGATRTPMPARWTMSCTTS